MGAPSALSFSDLLRYHRSAAGLTQEELAERAQLSVDAVSTLERGARRKPRKDTVALLADALALSSDDRAALVAAARCPPADPLAATPHEDTARNGRLPAATGDLPRGVVTFLFADIEGSAQLLQQLGDRYADLLAELQELLHTIYITHHGRELGTQGDRFFAVFAHPDDAVSAAVEAQRVLAGHPWPDGADVRLRMGVHTGGALVTAGRYVGLEVARAANLAAAGHGGQILLSRAAVEEVAKRGQEYLPGTALRHLGSHRLRDLGSRETLYQLTLPGLPDRFPPLRTLDIWPVARAHLVAGALLTLTLLTLAGLVLPFVVPTFPRALGLIAGVADLLLVVGVALAPTQQPRLRRQWRAMRQPVVALTSGLLSLVVVLTTLFASMPRQVIASHPPQGYDFSYTYHQPTHTGGSITIETALPIHTLLPPMLRGDQLPDEVYHPVWNACVVQLPDLKLPSLDGWKPDQCSEVPSVANGEEDPSGKWTIFRIDPRAVWSDGQPLTADDFLFTWRLSTDPNVQAAVWPCECPSIDPPWSLMRLTRLDMRTVRIDWSKPYVEYLTALAQLTPLPLHVYTRGQYAGVYNALTGAYNSGLARRLAAEPNFNLWIPVDNGPFLVKRVDGYGSPFPDYKSDVISTAQRLVLARNPRFFSNFFHKPSLDQVTFETVLALDSKQSWPGAKTLIANYRQGGVTVLDALGLPDLPNLSGIPKGEVVTSPIPDILTIGFNQRGAAPNARANGGVSIFADHTVRKAFAEAFDRCAAFRAVVGLRNCNDPTFHTDEHAAPPSPDFDKTDALPAYNPTDAARLLERAGYPLVAGVRRYKDGVTPLQLLVSLSFGGSLNLAMAHRMQQDYARNLHIAVQILQAKDGSYDTLFGGASEMGAFDIGVWRENVGPDPAHNLGGSAWNSADIPSEKNPNGINFLGLIDPWVVAQDRLATRTVDGAQRAVVYKGMVRHVTEQVDYLPLFIAADIALVKPTLCNFKKWPALGFYLWNMADWYVAPSCP